jgi:hypothetical protein
MQFSVQWAGVSVAYVGMIGGTVMGWRVAATETFLPIRIFSAGAGTLFGGGVAIPFVASNFVSAYLALWLARGLPFGAQFATFAVISLGLGAIVLTWLDHGLKTMGGLHLDLRTMMWALAMAGATFALALLLMRFAPTNRLG